MAFDLSREHWWYIVLVMTLGFLWLTFNQQIASIYLIFLIADYFVLDKYASKLRFHTSNIIGNSLSALTYAVVAYIIFMGVSIIGTLTFQALLQFKTQLGSTFINEVLSRYAATTPLLAENKYLTLLSWGVIVPIIETKLFFGRLFELCADFVGASLTNFRDYKTWFVMIFVSVLFMLFHIQAKGVTDNVALMMTFLFAMISMLLVMWTQELEAAIELHIINNSVTVWNILFRTAGGAIQAV
jgi:membrane protease YdiL (CAAX protease family)